MQPIRMGVIDGHPYVRRTAVMGVLKVYNLDSNAVRNAGKPRVIVLEQLLFIHVSS